MLQLLRAKGIVTRADLAATSGLSAAAVTNLINELAEAGLVQDQGVAPHLGASPRLGRPASRLSLAPRGRVVLALQLGAGAMQVGVCDLEANILASESLAFPVPSAFETVLSTAAQALGRVVADADVDRGQVLGLGVGVGGLVDPGQRVSLMWHNLGWENVPIADYFERALEVPVVVDHNVRAMAVGESRYGLGRGLESLAFVYVGSGVGAGLILAGTAYRGGTHRAAEIGHLQAAPDGLTCSCGSRGCLETVVNDRVLQARVAAWIAESAVSEVVADPGREHGWVHAWADAVRRGHPAARALLEETAEYLSDALVPLVHLLNPQLIVIGGLLDDLSPVLLEPLRRALVSRVLPLLRDAVAIAPTGFGAAAGLIGAATVALDQFLFGASLIEATKAGQPGGLPSPHTSTATEGLRC